MKRSITILISALILLSMLLGACQTAAPTTEAPAKTEAPVKTEAPAEPTKAPEPTDEPEPEPVMASPDDLDAAFTSMLGNMQAYNTIKADALMAAMVEDTPPFILDVRTAPELEENGHIEGAVHIPLNELAMHIDLLPDFDTPIVAYCGSGWRATIAMTILTGMGWNDVKALKATFADWKDAGNPVVEGLAEEAIVLDAAKPDAGLVAAADVALQAYGVKPFGVTDAETLNTTLVENPDLIVIDVRRAEELEENGVIDTGGDGPLHIALEDFVANREMWPADMDAEIVVYCGSGHRSTMAMTILWDYGYTSVTSLKGGFGGWVGAGYPVVGGAAAGEEVLDEAFDALLSSMQAYNTIKADALMALLVEDAPPFLLDVRSTEEVEENGHIEGATHIPLAELTQHLDLLPDLDTPIVTYCGSGWRATIAMTALKAMGWEDVKALKALFSDWKDAGNPVAEGLPENISLDIAEPDSASVAAVEAMLSTYGVKPYGVIDAETLNTTLVESPDMILIDVRRAEELADNGVIDTGGDLPIHIALEQFVEMKELWPADKDAAIVIYCGSGHRSTMALTILGTYGYTDVKSLKGGFGGWVSAGFPTAEFAVESGNAALDANLDNMLAAMAAYNTIKADGLMEAMVEDTPPYILDVRTTAEVEENGHIEGAYHIPLAELAQHIDVLPSFDTPIVAYCGSGWRATIAMTALHAMGWTDVKALKVTFADWVAAGNPVVEGLPENMALDIAEPDAGIVAVVDEALSVFGVKPYGVIDAEGLNTALVENPELIVIDVRRAEELAENGVIDSGDSEFISIPLEVFIAEMGNWPIDLEAPIVVYCGSGHRSTMAMAILWFYGYFDVSSLKGGFGGWAEAGFPVAEFVAQ